MNNESIQRELTALKRMIDAQAKTLDMMVLAVGHIEAAIGGMKANGIKAAQEYSQAVFDDEQGRVIRCRDADAKMYPDEGINFADTTPPSLPPPDG